MIYYTKFQNSILNAALKQEFTETKLANDLHDKL
jgi:hypothetical protein